MSARSRLGRALVLAALAAAPAAAPAGGLAGRSADAPWRPAFPRDHAAHPGFRTEWWYYTGHLRAGERRFGFELTFFRVGLDRGGAPSPSAWAARDLMLAHAALTDERAGRFRFDERALRAALGLAGADSARYRVWVDDWRAGLAPDGRTHVLRATARSFALALDLVPLKPPAVHDLRGAGEQAVEPDSATHYYSITRLAASGRVAVGGDTLAVLGEAWMDHEFMSSVLAPGQVGWDWLGLQLDDGSELMLYRLRRADGSTDAASSGTRVAQGGAARRLRLADWSLRARGAWRSPHTGARYPAGWEVRVPGEGLWLRLTPTVADQELVTEASGGVDYWEGSVRIEGTARGRPVGGRGYVELTGYAGAPPGR